MSVTFDTEPLVQFYADSHSYYHRKLKLESVTGWIKDYCYGFNSSYWLEYKVLQKCFPVIFETQRKKYSKNRKLILPKVKQSLNKNQIYLYQDQIKFLSDEWSWEGAISGSKGTAFHAVEENKAFSTGFCENPYTGKKTKVIDLRLKTVPYQNHSLGVNLLEELPDGHYPEFLAWYLPIATAGQVDQLWIETIKGVRYVDIGDHKTTKEKNMKKGGMSKMKGDLGHLDENALNKYMIQINFYAWMLMQHGFVPRNLSFTWYKDYNFKTAKRHKVEFQPKLIEKMITGRHKIQKIRA